MQQSKMVILVAFFVKTQYTLTNSLHFYCNTTWLTNQNWLKIIMHLILLQIKTSLGRYTTEIRQKQERYHKEPTI